MIGLLPENLNFLTYRLQKRSKENKKETLERSLEEIKVEIKKILKKKRCFDYIYYVGRNNEDKIYKDIENYIRSYCKFL